MRLTIVNLFDFGANGRGTERPASILARKPGKMNPPYAGGRTAADAAYKISAVKEARRSLVVCARVRKPPPQPSPASGRGGRPQVAANTDQKHPAVMQLVSFASLTRRAFFLTQPARRRSALPLPLAGEDWGGGCFD